MAERNYEITDYNEWLNKPNKLIEIDRCALTGLHSQAINVMLHKVQLKVFEMKKDKNYTFKDLACHDFIINSNELKELFSVGKGTSVSYIAKDIAKLNEVNLTDYRDSGGFKSIMLFPNVEYNAKEFYLKFRINTEIAQFMTEGSKSYTRLDLCKLREYRLNKYAFNLLETIHKNMHKFFTNGYVEFNVDEFKRLVGSKADCTNSYFKLNIMLKAIKELKDVVGIEVDYAIDNSLSYNKIKSLRLYFDCKSEINKNFVHDYNSIRTKKSEDEKADIIESLSKEKQKMVENGTAYIHSITGEYIGKVENRKLPTIKMESKLVGRRYLLKYLLELGKEEKVIKAFLSNKDYGKYIKIMIKYDLKQVSEELFELGYRYIIGDDK